MHYFIKNIIFFTLLHFLSFSLFAQQGSGNSTTGEELVVKKNGFLSSLVLDEAGMPLIVQIDITDNATNKIVQQFESSRIGYSRISLASGNYNIVFSKPGYLFHSENFILPDSAGFEKKLKKIILKKVQIGSNTELNNISFEENKSVLKESSFTDLERVIALMNEIVSLQIEITGTVDEDLPSKTKSELAEQRAKVLINYLVSKGIDKERLKFKGADAKKPIELVQSNGLETNEEKEKTSLTVIKVENKEDIAQTGGEDTQFGLPESSTKKKTFGKKNKPKTELVQEKTDTLSVNTPTELAKQETQTEPVLASVVPIKKESAKEEPASVVKKSVKEEPQPIVEAVAKKEPVVQEVKTFDNEPVDGAGDALKKTVAAPTPQPVEVLREEPKQEENTTVASNEKSANNATKSSSVNTILSEISFENNKSVLKKSAFSDLDRVIEQMNENVSLEVEIPGTVNEDLPSKTKSELAEQRATVLINYLVAQGIDRSRLKYKGENANKSIQLVETEGRKESDDNKKNVALVEKNENAPDNNQAVVESPENAVVKQEAVLAANNKREERIEEPAKEEKEPVVEAVAKEEPVKQEVKTTDDEAVEKSNDALKKILAAPTPQPAEVLEEVPKSVVEEEPVEVAKEVQEESAPKPVDFAKEETAKEEPVKQELKAAENELVEESNDALKKTVAAPTPQPVEVLKEESVESTPVAVEPAKEELAKEEVNTPRDEPLKVSTPSISLPPKFVKYDKDKNGIVSYMEIINGIDVFFDDDSLTNGAEISELIEYFFDNQ